MVIDQLSEFKTDNDLLIRQGSKNNWRSQSQRCYTIS